MTDTDETTYTADVVCVRDDDHVLLIERDWPPYKGCWALPGGYLDPGESSLLAAVRELGEETGVQLTTVDLREIGSWDEPGRDPRGVFVTTAYLALVSIDTAIEAGDDARAAAWFPLADLPDLAFDHADIVAAAVRMLPSGRTDAAARPTPEVVAATEAVMYDVTSDEHGRVGPYASLRGATAAATNVVAARHPGESTRFVDLADRREIQTEAAPGAWFGTGVCVELSTPTLIGAHDAWTGWYHAGVPADEMDPQARAWAVEVLRAQYGAAHDAWTGLVAEAGGLLGDTHTPGCYNPSIIAGERPCGVCLSWSCMPEPVAADPVQVRIVSFGYGHGRAPVADLTYDLRRRFRNPHVDPAMREMTGLDHAVYDHVLATPGVERVALSAADLVTDLLIETESGDAVTVAAGCVGGRHRSVVLARRVAELLIERGVVVGLVHRDVDRPVLSDARHLEVAPGR
ncbi:NUDIX domain-containing protein [Embleya sp. NPDC059237]|uniref:RapZ C-terminal domain-containing protein n=1 Tax=Embleya sp. NPDC059237 TaxID=3346784 RepID=UPI0036CC24BF